MSNLLINSAISAAAAPIAETVIATVSVPSYATKTLIRGHVLATGNAVASTMTFRIRQGSLTGNIIYNSGALSFAAAAVASIPFGQEDDTNLTPPNSPTTAIGVWVLTVQASAAGNINGGNISTESIP